jgi:hypothetical protein
VLEDKQTEARSSELTLDPFPPNPYTMKDANAIKLLVPAPPRGVRSVRAAFFIASARTVIQVAPKRACAHTFSSQLQPRMLVFYPKGSAHSFGGLTDRFDVQAQARP